MRPKLILLLACLLLLEGCTKATDPASARRNELTRILKDYLKPGVSEEDYQTADGWYESANRQALTNFVTKYPETEEGYEAEVWLIFGLPQQEKQGNAALAERLKTISERSTRSGTVKMAKLERAWGVLFEENRNDHTEFKKQTEEILSQIKEYKSEREKSYVRYLGVGANMRPAGIEPTLRYLMTLEEVYAHDWDRALDLANELKRKFPAYDRQSVNSQIDMIKLYKSGWTENSSSSIPRSKETGILKR